MALANVVRSVASITLATLFGVAIALPFVANTVGFVPAVLLILTLRGHFRSRRPETATSVRADIAEGVRWLRGHALPRGLTLVSAGTSFAQSMTTAALSRRFGRPAVLTTGSVIAAVALGLMSCTRNAIIAGALFASSSAGVMTWNVLTMSLRQTLIPRGCSAGCRVPIAVDAAAAA